MKKKIVSTLIAAIMGMGCFAYSGCAFFGGNGNGNGNNNGGSVDDTEKPGDNEGNKDPENPGDNTGDNEGNKDPENPGDNTGDNEGNKDPENPGDNTGDNEGNKDPENPGDNTGDNEGNKDPENPGDNTGDNEGNKDPENPNPPEEHQHTFVGDVCTGCGYVRPSTGNELTLTLAKAGDECAFFEWSDTKAASAKVFYRLKGSSSWTAVDGELIRQYDKTARVDIVGLKGGELYEFKLQSGEGKTRDISLPVAAKDRSGFAHFGATEGVGAYNNDGTPKKNAIIVYVTEETKNTVTATIGGKKYTGIVSILQHAGTDNNLIVRILGTVGAATWNKLEYNGGKAITWDKVVSRDGTKNLKSDIDNGNIATENSGKRVMQAELVKQGYNTLNTSEYSELNGLTSYINYDKSKSEFDSCWNNCAINAVENVTVEGIGEDATIFQWGMTWSHCKSIEVRNLTFDDYTEDACSFEGNQSIDASDINGHESGRIWFHNNTVNEGINYWDVCNEQDKHEGDGGTDLKGVTNVTLSYNHYYKNHKTGLVGSSSTSETANVTFHHNYYENCVSRLPLARQANMHMYNNYYSGSTGTNMSLRANAYAFIENCYFDNASNAVTTSLDGGNYGFAKLLNNTFTGKSQKPTESQLKTVTDRTAKVTNTNKFGQNFDTDAVNFYYDAANKHSDVTTMLKTEYVPEIVPLLAGVLGDSNPDHTAIDLTGKESISTSTGDIGGGDTPVDPDPDPVDPDVPDDVTEISYFADNIAADTVLAAENGINNSLFTFNADESFTCSGGKDGTAIAAKAVKATLMDGSEHTFTKGFKCTTFAPADTDGNGQRTVAFSFTANKKITLRLYVNVTNDSYNSNRDHTITYQIGDGAPATTKRATDRLAVEVIEVTLEAGQTVTVYGTNYNQTQEGKTETTAKIWLFGAEAKVV